MSPIALSLVERGWQGPREHALKLAASGTPVLLLVKGYVGNEIRDLIQKYDGIRVVFVHHSLFRLAAWGRVAWYSFTGRLKILTVTRERALREFTLWCRLFRVETHFIRNENRVRF